MTERLAGQCRCWWAIRGVGKSTLVNALVPDARRSTGDVNAVSARAGTPRLARSRWRCRTGAGSIDTPGIRTFGLAHVEADHLIEAFPDLDDVTDACPRGCTHGEGEPECGLDEATGQQAERVQSFRRLLASREAGDAGYCALSAARALEHRRRR